MYVRWYVCYNHDYNKQLTIQNITNFLLVIKNPWQMNLCNK